MELISPDWPTTSCCNGCRRAHVCAVRAIDATQNRSKIAIQILSQGNALPLSRDHTAEQEDERQRIVQAGGQVNHVMGSWRIGQAGIQVSRYDSSVASLNRLPVLCVLDEGKNDGMALV